MASKSHVVLPGSKRGKDPTAKRIGEIDPNQPIDVTVTLAGPKLPGADEYVGQRLTHLDRQQRLASTAGKGLSREGGI